MVSRLRGPWGASKRKGRIDSISLQEIANPPGCPDVNPETTRTYNDTREINQTFMLQFTPIYYKMRSPYMWGVIFLNLYPREGCSNLGPNLTHGCLRAHS